MSLRRSPKRVLAFWVGFTLLFIAIHFVFSSDSLGTFGIVVFVICAAPVGIGTAVTNPPKDLIATQVYRQSLQEIGRTGSVTS